MNTGRFSLGVSKPRYVRLGHFAHCLNLIDLCNCQNAPPMPGSIRCECTCALGVEMGCLLMLVAGFKLFLEPKSLRDGTVDPRLPGLPVGSNPSSLFFDAH